MFNRTLTPSDQDEVPKIGRGHVEEYVLWRQALDQEPNKDSSAIANGEKMITEVLALSFFMEPPPASSSTEETSSPVFFATGIVAAEMRTKVAYSIKIALDGATGEVLQAHCEGPAGRGPTATCKHIVAVLLMLVKFVEEGKLLVRQSCTETLQTFKRPTRAHDGSPKRAEKIGRQSIDHDPRPKEFRNMPGYADFVFNATTNFCARTSLDLTMRYAYPRADLEAAVYDHYYLSIPFTQH